MLKFEAYKTYVAIDDIKFTNCAFPPTTGACNFLQVGCDNGACIDPHLVSILLYLEADPKAILLLTTTKRVGEVAPFIG